ncbi:neuroparsin-A-like [Daphnia carinata]|uniref:neuroparsin-A-like n=1 Tax=Daphnia carinata TaxID=120202 RepID=UPI00257BB88C|nr:neuroparsin-A-like [Daphnia carinata]
MHQKNTHPFKSAVWPFFISAFFIVFVSRAHGAPRCTACADKKDCLPPKNCIYGVVKDYCGRDICAKGPGHRCGGKWNSLGTCGEGLFCSCNRCGGCSLITLECFNLTCI